MHQTLRLGNHLGARYIHLNDADSSIGFATIQTKYDMAYPEEGHVDQVASTGIWRLHGGVGIWVICMDRDKIRVSDIVFALNLLSHVTKDDYRLIFEWEDIKRFNPTSEV